jgi:hypothetical protein
MITTGRMVAGEVLVIDKERDCPNSAVSLLITYRPTGSIAKAALDATLLRM